MSEPPTTQDMIDAHMAEEAEAAYSPDLGQSLFSNTPWQAIEAPDRVQYGLSILADIVAEQRGDEGPLTSNYGGDDYVGPAFSMRAYCWCDGDREGHEDGCPPNFEHPKSGVVVAWYKWAGRGTSMSRATDAQEWGRIIRDCLASLTP